MKNTKIDALWIKLYGAVARLRTVEHIIQPGMTECLADGCEMVISEVATDLETICEELKVQKTPAKYAEIIDIATLQPGNGASKQPEKERA